MYNSVYFSICVIERNVKMTRKSDYSLLHIVVADIPLVKSQIVRIQTKGNYMSRKLNAYYRLIISLVILIFVLTACSAKKNNEPNQPLICTNIMGKNKITDWGIILKHLDSSDIPVVHELNFSNASTQYLDVIECGYSSDRTSLIVTFSLGESLIGKTEQDAIRFIQDLSALGYTNHSISYVKVEESYKGKVLDVVDIQTSHVITIILVGE